MREYFRNLWKRIINPEDNLKYLIPAKAILDTERVLKEYANFSQPNEGLVYWGGQRNGQTVTVSMVIAPKTQSNWGRVTTSNRSNFDFVRILNKHGLVHIAQVHSHPTDWVDHSSGDDLYAAFKREGLLSIVVPDYCLNGIKNLTSCGCHRYTKETFVRLSKAYINKHFFVVNQNGCFFEDSRI